MNKNFVLAITGPAGAGKSTVATKVAKQFASSVNIDADCVKHFIVDGFVYGEGPNGIKQWELLGKNIGMLAGNFREEGYNVIINGYINEPAWKALRKHIQLTHKILLLPQVETAVSRDSARPGDEAMGAETVERHHAYFSKSTFYQDFMKINSTEHEVDETVEEIVEKIEEF